MIESRIVDDHGEGTALYFLQTGPLPHKGYSCLEWWKSGEVTLLIVQYEDPRHIVVCEEVTDVPLALNRIKEFLNAQ